MKDRTSHRLVVINQTASTQDKREQHALASFELSDSANLDAIEQVALTLPGSKTANKTEDYLRVEYLAYHAFCR